MSMTAEIKVNGMCIESYYIENLGALSDTERQDPEGWCQYHWVRRTHENPRHSSPGGEGRLNHRRGDGVTILVTKVLAAVNGDTYRG